MQCLLLKEKNRKGEQRRRGKKEGRDRRGRGRRFLKRTESGIRTCLIQDICCFPCHYDPTFNKA